MRKKRAEARTRYYCREESKRLGWDIRHPTKGGSFLEEQEVVDYLPELKECLGLNKPDFLLLHGTNPNLVIETKSKFEDIKNAIDEAIEYSNIISKVYPIKVAVGIAGTPDTAIQVRVVYKKDKWVPLTSHGYQLTQIPTPEELQTALNNDDATTDVRLPDFSEFYEAAISISRMLRTAKIEEIIRPKVIGAIVLALYQGDFSTESNVVLNHINANVEAAIKNCKDVPPDRRDYLINVLKLSTESRAVPAFINSIILQLERLNIRSIMRSGVDFLGQFYEAFLRYGADSKKLGIVFTPRHITRYCAELTQADLGMKVYDPACGTGGFLVAAFDRMMASATSKRAIAQAKNSLYGYDSNSTVWALAVLNMIFRGDGKSNIELVESCFNHEESTENQFNRVLLNPPFSQENEPETMFIDHSLKALKAGGELAAVVPTGILADDAHINWRKQLILNHSVLATISMPVDLFYPTGSPTSLLVVRAHTPHYKNHVMMAKVHNDGFTISKNKRIPIGGSQLPIVASLLNQYREKNEFETVPSLACCVPIDNLTNGQELCAEQWLPQDMTSEEEFNNNVDFLLRQMFLATVNYPNIVDAITYDYEEALLDISSSKAKPSSKCKLNYIFEVKMAKSTGISNYPEGQIPYISSGDTYNSIVGAIMPDPSEIYDYPVLTVTGFGGATIQPWCFCARGNGGSAVRVLHPLFPMSLAEFMWYACQINRQRWRFHYGRMAIISRLKNLDVEPYPGYELNIKKIGESIRAFNSKLLDLIPNS